MPIIPKWKKKTKEEPANQGCPAKHR